MFEFYLSGAELAFRRMGHMNWQLQLTREQAALPTTRDYIWQTERQALIRTLVGGGIHSQSPPSP
jgi:cyclopropane-fatty-acyl-phospholipid synthase